MKDLIWCVCVCVCVCHVLICRCVCVVYIAVYMPPAIIIINAFSSGFIWTTNEAWLSIYVVLCVFAIEKEAV